MKNLTKLALVGIASLTLAGCPALDKFINSITGQQGSSQNQDSAYNQAVKIVQNPGSVFTGNAVSSTSQGREETPNRLENYFLQGEELDKISLVPKEILESKEPVLPMFKDIFNNPLIYPQDFLEGTYGQGIGDSLSDGGYAVYSLPESNLGNEPRFKMLLLKSKSNNVNEKEMEKFSKEFGGELNLATSDAYIGIFLDKSYTKDEADTLINSLKRYKDRIHPSSFWINSEKVDENDFYLFLQRLVPSEN